MTARDARVTDFSPGEEEDPSQRVSRMDLSFQAIYRQYFDFVWSCTRRLGIEPAAMDDVVQEIFIVIHGRLHTLERPEALRSWLYGIVRRTVSTHRRAGRALAAAGITTGVDVEIASLGPTPFEQTEKNAEIELLSRLLGTLDEPKREIFALVELEELSVPEAAEALQIPLNTASSRLRAARQAFEAALARVERRSRGT
jgi:RNA polymerase sigma-70 factor, ECF subfamily